MTTLLVAEHDNETLSDQTAKALTAAKAIGGDVHVLVAGKDAKAAPTRRPSSTVLPRCFSPTTRRSKTGWPSQWRR
jgi:electron transfer flavoprotein alpha subunit